MDRVVLTLNTRTAERLLQWCKYELRSEPYIRSLWSMTNDEIREVEHEVEHALLLCDCSRGFTDQKKT